MAIAPTGAIYKAFTYDGETSRDFGLYITGVSVYNAPEREVEMISVPGRNGDYALDLGRFTNAELVYHCGLYGSSEAEFREALASARAWICSKRGYKRLEDDYNPDEYRLAVYKSGLDVDAATLRSGEFDLTFTCQPHRYLKSGETAVTVSSGDTITNPTLYAAQPLLAVNGYGQLALNDNIIQVAQADLGEVLISQSAVRSQTLTANGDNNYTRALTFDVGWTSQIGKTVNDGDAVYFGVPQLGTTSVGAYIGSGYVHRISLEKFVFSASTCAGCISNAAFIGMYLNSALWVSIGGLRFGDWFAIGTASTSTGSATIDLTETVSGTNNVYALELFITIAYDGADTMTVTITGDSLLSGSPGDVYFTTASPLTMTAYGTANSTVSALGNPLYIDLEIGEAYQIKSGEAISSNAGVTLPEVLPTLEPGANAITFDNTFTKVAITPRWWTI